MEYNVQEIDFVYRTRKIIEQYDELFKLDNNKEHEKYEVTLFLNCCVGLLIIPKQDLNGLIPKKEINKDEHGIDPKEISFIQGNSKGFNEVTRRLRNCIAHSGFRIEGNNEQIKTLEYIVFTDRVPGTKDDENITFEARIKIKDFVKFCMFLSDVYLRKMALRNDYESFAVYKKKFYPLD